MSTQTAPITGVVEQMLDHAAQGRVYSARRSGNAWGRR